MHRHARTPLERILIAVCDRYTCTRVNRQTRRILKARKG